MNPIKQTRRGLRAPPLTPSIITQIKQINTLYSNRSRFVNQITGTPVRQRRADTFFMRDPDYLCIEGTLKTTILLFSFSYFWIYICIFLISYVSLPIFTYFDKDIPLYPITYKDTYLYLNQPNRNKHRDKFANCFLFLGLSSLDT